MTYQTKFFMEIDLNKFLHFTAIIFGVTAALFCFLAILYHPLVGDDFLNQHSILQGTFFEYIINSYTSWSGRLFSFIVPGVFFLNNSLLLLFKILVIPSFLAMSLSAFYLATTKLPWSSYSEIMNFIIFTAILWLGLPVLGITVVWLSGSIYLWMSTITLLFLSFLLRLKLHARAEIQTSLSFLGAIFLFLLAFFVGVTGLQFILTTILVLTYWSFQLFKEKRLKFLSPSIYFVLLGFIIGVYVFFSAPGNYTRLEYASSVTLLSNLKHFVLFVFGAYFGVGVGDLGRSIWIGALLIFSLNTFIARKHKIIESSVWFVLSLLTLLPFLPLIYFAAPRVTFFTMILFLIGVQSLCTDSFKGPSHDFKKPLAASILLLLVAVDGFVGFAANRSLNIEVTHRMELINQEIASGSRNIVVPNYATIPSRLTYMQTPQHDQEYLQAIAENLGIDSIILSDEQGFPRPRSLQPLKALKGNGL